ncbi:MAG: nucleotidyltransferase domain-containing protein [Chitinophagaceae bacterium]|nr:nucleotidyltransferase domain-containing protein [Chitinophagaceae bacterium]
MLDTRVNNRFNNRATFPTNLHLQTAELTGAYLSAFPIVDTFLVLNSCARGQAVPESDLDFAVLVHPDAPSAELLDLKQKWQSFTTTNPDILHYKKSHRFAYLHLDIIDGRFLPTRWDEGGGPDQFEVEIGNRIAYAAPLSKEGVYFHQLKNQWLPYYDETLRRRRFAMIKSACEYDIDHIPILIKRGLYFQAFDRLYKAFQEFLQILFIAHKTYPIAYNKWIKEQVESLLGLPGLYVQLPSIISVNDLESVEMIEKGTALWGLMETYCKSQIELFNTNLVDI